MAERIYETGTVGDDCWSGGAIIFEMAYIKELIDSLFEEENEGNVESFKKLIYLAVNEGNIFAPHAL